MDQLLRLGDVAKRFGCQLWQVQRLYDRGKVPAANVHIVGENGNKKERVVYVSELPTFKSLLADAGYVVASKGHVMGAE
jgi:hypothetical protein